jgi:RNA polymerase sigma factor (sigma-70 family)
MMNYQAVTAEQYTDTELVARSLAGDRDAFSRIVARYQILICSLAYSRIGHLGQSEDVAQETFITAWKHLRLLREPAKLRAWLCGIVQNRIHKTLRREGREPAHLAESLEAIQESPAVEALPSEQVISREEEAILWRSLEKIPELYREPLVLFYRGHESIATVAAQLELSEDAVKQRLARGRKLLQEEVQTFVESTLRRSAPGHAFSGAVLAALPAAPVATTAAGLAGKGAIVKSGWLAGLLLPLIGVLGGILAGWLSVRQAPTASERRVKSFAFTCCWIFTLGWCLPGQFAMRALKHHWQWNDTTYYPVMALFWWIYAAIATAFIVGMFRQILAIRKQSEGIAAPAHPVLAPAKPVAVLAIIAGTYLALFWGFIFVAWQANDRIGVIVMVLTMVALGVWRYFQTRARTGVEVIRKAACHLAVAWGAVLVILNCRLETWMTALRGMSQVASCLVLPQWAISALTVALVIWTGFLLAITRPGRRLNRLRNVTAATSAK